MINITVFLSGSGTTFQAVYESTISGKLKDLARIVGVISNKEDAYGLERAAQLGVPTMVVKLKDFQDQAFYEQQLLSILEKWETDMVCLMGYLKLLPEPVIDRYPGHVLNSHPGPLPEFGGQGMYGERVHMAVLEFAKNMPPFDFTCATVHLVTKKYDEGPVIAYCSLPIKDKQGKMIYPTAQELQQAVLPFEYPTYIEAILRVIKGDVRQLSHPPIPDDEEDIILLEEVKDSIRSQFDKHQ
ncbi:MAG: formyltransferase family protein [bacterium]